MEATDGWYTCTCGEKKQCGVDYSILLAYNDNNNLVVTTFHERQCMKTYIDSISKKVVKCIVCNRGCGMLGRLVDHIEKGDNPLLGSIPMPRINCHSYSPYCGLECYKYETKKYAQQSGGRVCETCCRLDLIVDEDSKLSMKACSRCHNVHYCSKECQRLDWSNHKLICTEHSKK
jgi:hypothetical protein